MRDTVSKNMMRSDRGRVISICAYPPSTHLSNTSFSLPGRVAFPVSYFSFLFSLPGFNFNRRSPAELLSAEKKGSLPIHPAGRAHLFLGKMSETLLTGGDFISPSGCTPGLLTEIFGKYYSKTGNNRSIHPEERTWPR